MHWGWRQILHNQYTDLEKLRLRGMKELNINLPPIYKVPFEDLTSNMIVYEHHFCMMQHAMLMISIMLLDANEGSTSPAMPIQPDHSEDDSPEVGIGAPEDVYGAILELLQLKGCTVPDCVIHKSYVKLLKEIKDINVGVECEDMATKVASFILSLEDMIPLVKYDMEDKGYKLKHDDAFGNNVIMNALIDVGKKDEFNPEGRVNLASDFIVYFYPGKF